MQRRRSLIRIRKEAHVATNAAQMAKTDKFGDLRRRLVFATALIVYRIGAHSGARYRSRSSCNSCSRGSKGGILSLFNMFSGGALSRFTIFALGIMPYISASIIMQLLTYVLPAFEQLKKEGEAGRRKITQYTRYGTWAWPVPVAGHCHGPGSSAGLVIAPGFGFRLTSVVTLTAGTMFLMWLGEQITERGLGNGISILIFGGIAAGPQFHWWLARVGTYRRHEHHHCFVGGCAGCGGLPGSWCSSSAANARSW